MKIREWEKKLKRWHEGKAGRKGYRRFMSSLGNKRIFILFSPTRRSSGGIWYSFLTKLPSGGRRRMMRTRSPATATWPSFSTKSPSSQSSSNFPSFTSGLVRRCWCMTTATGRGTVIMTVTVSVAEVWAGEVTTSFSPKITSTMTSWQLFVNYQSRQRQNHICHWTYPNIILRPAKERGETNKPDKQN